MKRNVYDPESLMTGAEEAEGMTYENSRRNWRDEASRLRAVSGGLTHEEIVRFGPRVLKEVGVQVIRPAA